VILCPGGRSLPKSGSDGGGFELARSLHHSLTAPIVPALVPLLLPAGHWITSLSGLALRGKRPELRSFHQIRRLLLRHRQHARQHVGPDMATRILVPLVQDMRAGSGGIDQCCIRRITARTVGQKMAELIGQPVLIENRAGAAGTIGAEFVAKGVPDGHLLLVAGPGSVAVAPLLFPKLGYDPLRDFAPISLIATGPNVLVVHPALPVKNVKDLVALARQQPGQMNYASVGPGSIQHLAGESFNLLAGVKTVHVPYKGSSPAGLDLMAGAVWFTRLVNGRDEMTYAETLDDFGYDDLMQIDMGEPEKDSDRPDTPIGHDNLCRLQGARSASRATSERITTLQSARHVATAC
jgi:hypothetical protein